MKSGATLRPFWLPYLAVAMMGFLMLCSASVDVRSSSGSGSAIDVSPMIRQAWVDAVLAARTELARSAAPADERAKLVKSLWYAIEKDYPILWDWMLQDSSGQADRWLNESEGAAIEEQAISRVLDDLGAGGREMRAQFERDRASWDSRQRLDFYARACEQRRAARLEGFVDRCPVILFTKHYNIGGSHYAYTEGQSDAQAERHFRPGTALCILSMNRLYGTVENLIEDPNGVIRDPDVHFDGDRVLFSWKKSDLQDDYHIYEIDLKTRDIRQITDGLGFADYECAYLPDDDIVFSSTRCVQTVDCWVSEVSNLYTCDRDGNYLRRLGFDQVHTNYPTVMEDGRVIYTRWDYSDRGQIYPQGLFQMNPDGTGQTEFYGNNSWFPTSILHARGIPGSQKVVGVFSGHHCFQVGKLGILDPAKGRQENQGAQLVAPVRETLPVRVDAYGQDGELFQYPYPLSETEFLVTYDPVGWRDHPSTNRQTDPRFKVYYMTIDGRRELLAADPVSPCNQPMPLAPRKRPHIRPSLVDYSRDTGTYYIQDIYAGPGLQGVKRGTIKAVRVVALEYRASAMAMMLSTGPGGAGHSSSPPSMSGGAWDVKRVIGTAKVYEDGSAFFEAPARTPVYFQALDAKGHMVQSMRSWSTLQPGENFSCVGCHESKNTAPLITGKVTLAMKAGPQKLVDFYGPSRGFSFNREVQPILDRRCVSCHSDRSQRINKVQLDYMRVTTCPPLVPKQSEWEYTENDPGDGWHAPGFDSSGWEKGQGGFALHNIRGLKNSDWNTETIWLRATLDIPENAAARPALMLFHQVDTAEVYLNGVLVTKASGDAQHYTEVPIPEAARKTIRPGRNTLAIHAKAVTVLRIIDAAVVDLADAQPKPGKAFSLTSDEFLDPNWYASKRRWTDSYVALTLAEIHVENSFKGVPGDLVSWIHAQSAPPMLPPYYAGAAKSRLITMLEKGHQGVKLSGEELDKIACWIDLSVPFCGDYREAANWSEDELKRYDFWLQKRARMEEIERKNIRELVETRQRAAQKAGPTSH